MLFELTQRPCESRDAVFFDSTNLTRFLDFLDASQLKAHSDIQEIKTRIQVLDEIENQIKDIYARISVHDKRLEGIDSSLFNHQQKLLELEVHARSHFEQITKLEDENITNKYKIRNLEDNVNTLTKLSHDNESHLQKLQENVNNLNTLSESHTAILDKHDLSIFRLADDISRLPKLENNFNVYRDKMKQKMKKNKSKFQNAMNQITSKFTIIENFVKDLASGNKGPDGKPKAIDFPSLKLTETVQSNYLSLNTNEEKENANDKPLNNEAIDKLRETVENHEEDLILIKKYINSISGDKGVKFDTSKKDDKEKPIDPRVDRVIRDLLERISESEENYRHLIIKVDKRPTKEELELSHKQLFLQIERMNQRVNRFGKANTTIGVSNKEGGLNLNITEEEGGIPEGFMEEVKKTVSDTLKENELIHRSFQKHLWAEEEIKRLNDIISGLQLSARNRSDRSTEVPKEIKEIPAKFLEIEEMIRSLNKSVEELKFNEGLENPSPSPNIEEHKPINNKASVRDLIKQMQSKQRSNEERVEKVSSRIDSINHEILNKVKRDLAVESSRILEDFRADLKSSITRIQEQMREKVDKFNLDEFQRKLDLKIFTEISKKLDRNDLNKNTHVINKKIDNLENKISKTLVDALIDLQLEDAPLIVKKSVQGSDKCASCNQHLPLSSSNNLINQYNHLNSTIPPGENKEKTNALNSTNAIKRPNQGKTPFEGGDDLSLIKHRAHASSINFHLPDLNQSSNNSSKSNLNPKVMLKPLSKENKEKPQKTTKMSVSRSQLNLSQPIQYDEYSEKQLNQMINKELEQRHVNPDNLLKATQKVYENITKKA